MEVEDHQVEGVQHGEEDPPGPEDVGEPVHQAGQELVCQPLYWLLRVVEVQQEDLGVVLQLQLKIFEK